MRQNNSAAAPPVPAISDRPTPSAAAVHSFDERRRFIDTRFGRIAYAMEGRGEVALFLHGFPLTGFQWRGAFERLSGLRCCVAPDMLGLGYTEVRPGQAVTFPEQVAMLGEFLDRLGTATVDIVANDSNTGVAQLFALRWPERVRTLLLTNGDTEVDSPPSPLVPVIDLAKEGRFADELLAPQVENKDLARSPQGICGLTFARPGAVPDAVIDHYFGPLVASPERRALANAYAAALAPNPLSGIEPALRTLQTPTRIVWGSADTIFSPAGAAYLHRALPNSRGIRSLPDGKLFFPEEFPDVIAEEARQLWTS